MEAAIPSVKLRLGYLAAIKSIRLKNELNKENLVKELPTITDKKKTPINHNMRYLSDSKILKKPDLPPGMIHWSNGSHKKNIMRNGRISGYKLKK